MESSGRKKKICDEYQDHHKIFTDAAKRGDGRTGVGVSDMRSIRTFERIPQSDRDFTIQWIPSHVGIEGNEEADDLANRACHLEVITKL